MDFDMLYYYDSFAHDCYDSIKNIIKMYLSIQNNPLKRVFVLIINLLFSPLSIV